jgi:hypothetical protein
MSEQQYNSPVSQGNLRPTRENFEAQIIAKAFKDEAFRQELLSNPKAVIKEALNISVPEDVEIKVVEETSKIFYLVLPYIDAAPEAISNTFGNRLLGCSYNTGCDFTATIRD